MRRRCSARSTPSSRDLDPRRGLFEGLAAAEVCRGAGHAVVPLPIEAMLLRRPNGRPLAQLSAHGRLEHGDLFESWDVGHGRRSRCTITANTPSCIGSKVGPFVNREAPEPVGAADEPLSPIEHALLHVLPSWYLLGAAEKALDLATVYATERVQFGQPIASYQGVAFPLADACSELAGALRARPRLAAPRVRIARDGAGRRARLALGGARHRARVLRIAHQVLGAVGFCDEHDLTIITLGLQARLRLPPTSRRRGRARRGRRRRWASTASSPRSTSASE